MVAILNALCHFQRAWILLAALTIGGINAQAQHIHISAGALSGEPGSKLFFWNGYLYDTNSYGGITPACIYMNNKDRLYPGLYQTAASFTALPATLWTGGPTPYAAEQGAYIEMVLLSVQGPPGGEIAFWEETEDGSATTKMFGLPVGTTNSTRRFNLSEGIEFPDPDPFGHIHGRRFTASKPGLYTVGVQLIDTSRAGPNGGPIHSPSDTNYFYFQAGLFNDYISKSNNTVSVRFGSQGFNNYYLEMSSTLPPTNWVTLGTNIGGNHSDLHTLVDTNATGAMRFYRIREVPQ
jgi:hypothetical protein